MSSGASVGVKRRLLVTKRRFSNTQHVQPCSDCPWRRDALPSWLGALSVEDWIQAAHGEARIDCHVRQLSKRDFRVAQGPAARGRSLECAGAAIYRANVCKTLRDPSRFKLPPDRAAVFATPAEFRAYHGPGPDPEDV